MGEVTVKKYTSHKHDDNTKSCDLDKIYSDDTYDFTLARNEEKVSQRRSTCG